MGKILETLTKVKEFLGRPAPPNSYLNLATSTVGFTYTAVNVIKTGTKAIISPSPLCKSLYILSTGLNTISFVSTGVCLYSCRSCITPVPIIFGTLGWATSVGGRICNLAGDSINPTGTLTEKVVDNYIDNSIKEIITWN